MTPPHAEAPVSLAEARTLVRLRRGEPEAMREVWEEWKHRVWSVCRAMSPEAAGPALLAIYQDFPRTARGFSSDHRLCCQMGAFVFCVLAEGLNLDVLSSVDPTPPERVGAPAAGEELRARVDALSPEVRLVYLVDLFFHCPSRETSVLLGISEQALRAARSQAAWALIAERSA